MANKNINDARLGLQKDFPPKGRRSWDWYVNVETSCFISGVSTKILNFIEHGVSIFFMEWDVPFYRDIRNKGCS